MQKLASRFSGHWTIVDQSEPSPAHPKGITAKGEENWHTLAGSVPLIEEYHSKSPEGKDEYDTAAFWWDATSQKYRGLFCGEGLVDEGCSPFEIEWLADNHGDRITMSGEYSMDGKRFVWRELFEFPVSTKFTQTLFVAEKGHDLKKVSTISATRISGRP
jgi:hypothetical protein